MPRVVITATVPGDPDSVFDRISDFERYAGHTDAVREVVIEERNGADTLSRWSVNFRGGVLQWRERDRVDPVRRCIAYEQTEGDFAAFTGTWQIHADDRTVTVVFTADFDLGMPILAPMIDPIAERTLRDNMHAILRGLLGADMCLQSSAPADVPAA